MYNNFITNIFKITMKNYKELIQNFTQEDYQNGLVNLHIHSKYSDGKADFTDIMKQAEHYKAIAICDHNTIQGYLENTIYENVIPAIEFDVWFRYIFMHILAYGIDVKSEYLKPFLAKSKRETKWDIIRIFTKRNIKELIMAIHKAGGIAVIAHPACCWTWNLEKLIRQLKDYGLDGVEVFYPYQRHRGIIKFNTVKKVKEITKKHNLIMTGGTDLHCKKL